MRKSVSTPFAIFVIVVALVIGGLYFAHQYRAYEAQWQMEARMLQMQADAARRSGRSGMNPSRRGARMGAAQSPAGKPGAKGTAGPQPGGPAPSAKSPAKPEAKPAAKPETKSTPTKK